MIDAISDAYRSGLGNSDGAFPASGRSDAIIAEGGRLPTWSAGTPRG